jgi:hypothetical protein
LIHNFNLGFHNYNVFWCSGYSREYIGFIQGVKR